jgi:putative ABC transport system ATP-binding protein
MPAKSTQPVVRLSNVVKTYQAGDVQVPAVKGISLEIQRQRFSMIVGPSGAGKTTLPNLIGSRPQEQWIGQHDLGRLSDDAVSDLRAQRVGFIFQNFSLIPVLSAYENIEYPLLLLNEPPGKRHNRTMEMLDAVGLLDQKGQRPNQPPWWTEAACRHRPRTGQRAGLRTRRRADRQP